MTATLFALLTGLLVGALAGVWTGGAGRVWRMVFAGWAGVAALNKPIVDAARDVGTDEEAMAYLRRVCAGDKGPDVLPPPVIEDLWTGKPMAVPDRPRPLVEYEDADAVIDWPYVIMVAGLALLAALLVAGHP